MKFKFGIIILLMICCSCSSFDMNEKGEPVETTLSVSEKEFKELDAVKLSLDSLNNVMFPIQEETVQTRSWKKFFNKFLAIVTVDAVGAFFGLITTGPIGSATVGIASSAAIAFVPDENISIITRSGCEYQLPDMNSPETALSSNLIPIPYANETNTTEDSIGYYHNLALISIGGNLNNHGICLDSLIIKTADVSFNIYHTSRAEVLETLNSNRPYFNHLVNDILPERYTSPTIHQIFAKWISLYPEHKRKLTVLESFFNGLSRIEVSENDSEYLNKVLTVINQSSLDSETKQQLRCAAIVGNASYQLWCMQEN